MIIHDMEGQIEIGDTFKNPKFRNKQGKLSTFDRVVANPMWNQDWFTEADYDHDDLDRFPAGAGFPGKSSSNLEYEKRKKRRADIPVREKERGLSSPRNGGLEIQNGGRSFLSAAQTQGGLENPPSCLEGDSDIEALKAIVEAIKKRRTLAKAAAP